MSTSTPYAGVTRIRFEGLRGSALSARLGLPCRAADHSTASGTATSKCHEVGHRESPCLRRPKGIIHALLAMIVNCVMLMVMTTASARLLSATSLTIGALLLSACGSTSASDADITAVAAFYPLQFVTDRIAGDHVDTENLTSAGADPHGLELSPQQVAQITDADIIVYLSGFQPSVDQAVELQAPTTAFDVAEVVELREQGGHEHDHDGHDHGDHDHGDHDPHVWLDPTKLADIVTAVAEKLADIDPDNAGDYAANAEQLVDDLQALDETYATSLAECESRDIVTSHAAFGYLADRYDLHEVAVAGLSPDSTPTGDAIREVADYVAEHGVTTVFYETTAAPGVAETVAAETGAQTAVLNPLETVVADSGDDYFSIMESNLDSLVAALGCTA